MKEKIDLISQPKKSFWKLSIPIIAFCLFDTIYSIVDMMWVSRINIDAFYAMGVSIPFVTFVFSLGDSIGQGTNSIMSRFIFKMQEYHNFCKLWMNCTMECTVFFN